MLGDSIEKLLYAGYTAKLNSSTVLLETYNYTYLFHLNSTSVQFVLVSIFIPETIVPFLRRNIYRTKFHRQ